MTLLTNRTDALAAGHTQYFTGKPCKQGHTSNRKAGNGECMECRRISSRKHYTNNTEMHQEKAYRWKQNNPIEHNAITSSAHAKKKAQTYTPTNYIENLMMRYRYEDAQRLTAETGIKHEVDHIWPLSKGGPHLPWNLQVITAEENRSKSDTI